MPQEVRSKKEIVYTHDGITEELAMPEFQARGLHYFKDWMCSIGQDTLFIDCVGNVAYGSCWAGGYIGHIDTDDPWPRPEGWFQCLPGWCYCGAEIKQTKISPDKKHVVRPSTEDKYVIWDISKYCNFDCSYCPPTVHNRTAGHKPWEVLKSVVDRCDAYFEGYKGIQFSLSGGEPTFDPNISKLCAYIQELGHHVHVQSNGSRGKSWYHISIPLPFPSISSS